MSIALCLLTLIAPAIASAIDIYPGNSSLEIGSTLQFIAYVPLSPNTVTWAVNDIVGGNASVGTISATGLYVPPTTIPAANTFVIKARSTAYTTTFGATNLTLTRKNPWLWSTAPSSVSVGTFQISLNGANYASDSIVLINGTPVTTVYKSPTGLVATSTAAAIGTLQVSVRQPGAGTITGNTVALTVTGVPVVVSISPLSASVLLGATQSFGSSVTGTSNTAVTWSIASGAGTITTSGVYTAPAVMPASNLVTVRATSAASLSSYASASITLMAPPPPPIIVAVAPATASVQLGQTATFTSTVTGTANTAVTWSIGNGGGSINVSTGVYTAPAAMPASSSVTVVATSQANAAKTSFAIVTLTAPPPAPVSLHNARFLEQTSFGPTPATLAEIQQKGIPAFLDDQFNMPATVIPTASFGNAMGALTQWTLYNYTSAPDQLRQRVIYSLSQIVTTSSVKLIYPDEILPWMQLLSQNAFGNYRDILLNVSMCPSMGKYLDLAKSAKPSVAGAPNENYARELMQLFTIGLWQLNPDGSQQLDPNGNPIPTYNQQTVTQVALALTGWDYVNNSYENFSGPMIPVESSHDTTAKSILGWQFPAGQGVQQDLNMLIDRLMAHPNTAPFIATRLIRSLVTSNPSPAFVQRIAAVFADNGSGVAGDLKAVITAILLDPEARNDVPTVNSGRLKEPVLNIAGFLRALGGGFTPGQGLNYLFGYIGQSPLQPASVFSWFSPLYRLPADRTLFGPEFQIYSPSDSTLRGNYIFNLLHFPSSDATIDLTPFQPYGNDMPGLVEAANQALLYGRMPAAMKSVIITAATPGYDAQTRIETVLYLTALSGFYAVQQ